MRTLATLALIPILLLGCGRSERTLSVLAGSELKDVEPLADDIARHTGVRLDFQYTGTLDGAEKIMAGETTDLAWFSHAKYLTLLQERSRKVKAQDKIMLSPVVMGVKEDLARKWGWVDNPKITWSDVAEKAGDGELRYAMTNPASSNTGFTATLGVAAAFAGSADAITPEGVDAEKLKRFFSGQKLTAGSSGWLAEAYVREQDRLDGLINYESVLLQLNDSAQLREPLYLIYPQDGIVTADYPLMLLNGNERDAYQRLVDYLKSADFQQKLMDRTLRRPVNPQVKPAKRFPARLLVELPFPSSLQTVNRLLFAYLDEYRRPSHPYFVLDVSGSMQGQRINALKQAMYNLTGQDTSVTGQFARFRTREHVTIITFSSRVRDTSDFVIASAEADSPGMDRIRRHIAGLEANGGTAIYTALDHAYRLAGEAIRTEPDRFYSVVLMSDGVSNQGLDQDAFEKRFRAYAPALQQVKTFPVLFGEANERAMQQLAELTGGRVFDGRKESLSQVFKKIRGYQ